MFIKKKNNNICNLDEATKQLNKNKIDILTKFTYYKSEVEKLNLQQILYKDMKNEITILKNKIINHKSQNNKEIYPNSLYKKNLINKNLIFIINPEMFNKNNEYDGELG